MDDDHLVRWSLAERLKAEGHRVLEAATGREALEALPRGVEVVLLCTVDTVVATGRPYREILRVAEEQRTELLVVGVHGRGAMDRFLFGSTTEQLVRQAPCPVLTLRTG